MWQPIVDFIWRTKTWCVPVVVILGASQAAFFWGVFSHHYETGHLIAWTSSVPGIMLVIVGNLLYITFWHSKKRWPGTTAFERFARVVTFYR